MQDMSDEKKAKYRNNLEQNERKRGFETSNTKRGGTEQLGLTIDGKKLVDCRSFKYLGTTIEADGGEEGEISRRIALASAVYSAMDKFW